MLIAFTHAPFTHTADTQAALPEAPPAAAAEAACEPDMTWRDRPPALGSGPEEGLGRTVGDASTGIHI